jgi:YXWGXW repeat-containing protein
MRTIRVLLALLMLAIPAASLGQISIRVAIGPPALPTYEQPICPGDGYLWTPGYWAYDDSVSDYYWVPGTWVEAPEVGFLWTPGYWGWGEGGYFFNEGYWGPTVGFYGGVNYGFGYWGGGYGGGRWNDGHFFYNRSVNNIDVVNIHNVYNERVEINTENRVSYNGGSGGIEARPNSQQEAAARERHIPAIAAQTDHMQAARANPEQRAAVNHGRPVIAATAKLGDFSEQHGAVRANEAMGPSKAGTGGPATAARTMVHPQDLPPIARPAPIDSGNAKADRKYEQQQDKLISRQTQERQSLQQRQDVEHQQLAQQKASDARTQQVEQQHQQQTQQLSQRHVEQQQTLQSRQPQAKPQDRSHEKH